MITVIAEFKVKPECTDKFIRLAAECTRDTKKEAGNLSYKVILSATDTDTQEYFSKLCGRKTATRRSITNSGTITDSECDVPAIEPAMLGNLHPKLLLICSGGFLFLRKNYYFK